MTVSGMDSGSLGTLFSGLNSGGGLYTALSDYSSIRSGSYGKLLKSYYAQSGSDSVSGSNRTAKPSVADDRTSRGYEARYQRELEAKKNTQSSQSVSSSEASVASSNSKVASGAQEMVNSIDTLNKADTFKTTSNGAYNVDEIYKSVKSYVDAYNDVIDGSKKTNSSGISSNVSSITSSTKNYSKSLSEIGITVGEDKKLSIDENAFKNSDMSKVKSVFGRSSYGYNVRTNAYMTNYYAKQAQSTSNTYGASGTNSMSDIMSSFQSYI